MTSSAMMTRNQDWKLDYRLPQTTQPLNYDLYLFPDLENKTFSGRVSITIETKEPRDFLLTHTKWLEIEETKLMKNDGEIIELEDAFEYNPHEFWVVVPKIQLPVGTYKLSMKFKGRLDRDIVGFYNSSYTDSNGLQHNIATSKFQPTYARRAFPCFDEPSFKSTFKTTLVKPNKSGYMALSNMPEESAKVDQPHPGLTEVTFQLSVPMVTYLAIFIVCDFEHLETVTAVHNIPFSVYGTAQQKSRLDYALKIGAAISDFYETYFGIAYPLPKLDMAAIPDYSSGATEHWGLITYRESNLIYDPETSSAANKERVAMVIAHELAHQWFGNLMTVFWWNDLWLNEGFATYIEYKGVQSYEKDWDMESKFLTGDLHPVLELDATESSHPIVVDVSTPDEINAVFDTIAYNKGASVIRMMEDFMGQVDFRRGISAFLQKFSFQNAVTDDLLQELAAASSENLDIKHIMSTWTRQKGFPVVIIEKGPEKGQYKMTQQRFLASSAKDDKTSKKEESPYDYKWEIPLSYKTVSGQTTGRYWIHVNQETVNININDDGGLVKFNVGQYGYYRVQYPLEDWQQFSQLLQTSASSLSSSDRTSLLNDAFALSKAGRIPLEVALNMTLYLGHKERSVAPWETAFLSLDDMADVLYFTPVFSKLNSYLASLLEEPYQELGWTSQANDSIEKIKLRTMILKKMCSYGADANRIAGQYLMEMKENGAKISPDLREIVYSFGMKAVGNEQVWRWMLDLYRQESNAQEKAKLLRGLTAINEPWILSYLLELAKDESIIRRQDYFTLLIYMSWNRVGEPIVWDFVRNEWLNLVDRFTLNDRYMARMISEVTKKFATAQRLDEMEAFFQKYPEAGAGENYRKIALETVRNNINFLEKNKEIIDSWLSSQ